jgi:hypothetical protein
MLRILNSASEKLIVFYVIITSVITKKLFLEFYTLPNFYDVSTYYQQGFRLFIEFKIDDHIMPLYPIIIYLVDPIIGFNNFNILLSAANIYSLYLLAKILFLENKNLRLVFIMIVAFYPYNIFYSISGFSENFYIFFLINFLLFFYLRKPYIGLCFAVVGILVKPHHEFLIPIIVIFFYIFIYKNNIKFVIKNIIIMLGLYIIILSPWWVFNYQKYDKFIRTNLSANFPLYIGNNKNNKTGGGNFVDQGDIDRYPERFSKLHQDYNLDDFKGKKGFIYDEKLAIVKFKENPTIEDRLSRDELFKKEAIKFIINDKKKFAYLLYLKFKRFWILWPYTQEYQNVKYKLIAGLSSLPVIFGFAYGSLIILYNKKIIFYPLLIISFYFNLIHMITVSSLRYRYPIENFLIIISVYGCGHLLHIVKKNIFDKKQNRS